MAAINGTVSLILLRMLLLKLCSYVVRLTELDEELQLTLALESQTHNSWKQDPYGKGQALSIKREKRCWNDLYLAGLRTGVEEEVQDLLSWAGNRAEKMFPVNRLPWNQT